MGRDQVVVEAELGELMPADGPWWGGFLRGVPVRLAAVLRQGVHAQLCLAEGCEHLVGPAGVPVLDRLGRLVVPFLGEGLVPAELRLPADGHALAASGGWHRPG
ncbi:hypothetical protein ACIRP3_43335 [Streptomyces sp. NPDC101209]|uniref:hypothetical protein n=1 Tax=Streptomyces sp. NPDC101209 TaxID=3366129 RepID=UPI0038134F6C